LLPLIKDIFVGYEDDSMFEEKIQSKFLSRNLSLAIAESCTGGEIASRLTKIPGASGYFKGGLVVYQTNTKSNILDISETLIEKHSVVSKSVAELMALNVRKKFNSSIGISTTGNAGPSKGDSDAEVGTVWIAIAINDRVYSERFIFGKNRNRIIGKAVNKALELLFKQLI
jgi:nicotinamide-nucleotide amidase